MRDPFPGWLADLRAQAPPIEVFDATPTSGRTTPTASPPPATSCWPAWTARRRAGVVFPMHEPDGYPPANDMVIADAADSGGRLTAFCRLDPAADPLAEAERCLAAGAAGIKLHPRAESFDLDTPELDGVFALAHERRLPVLVHAGRGIPALGRHAVDICERYPGRAPDPRARGHLRPGLDLARRGGPPQPVLRHLVVVAQRPAGALRAGAAAQRPVRQRRALRHPRRSPRS